MGIGIARSTQWAQGESVHYLGPMPPGLAVVIPPCSVGLSHFCIHRPQGPCPLPSECPGVLCCGRELGGEPTDGDQPCLEIVGAAGLRRASLGSAPRPEGWVGTSEPKTRPDLGDRMCVSSRGYRGPQEAGSSHGPPARPSEEAGLGGQGGIQFL